MSYNITRWRGKTLEGFQINKIALGYKEDYLEHPELDMKTGLLTFEGRASGFELIGRFDGDWFVVQSITSSGEGSGTFQEYLTKSIFPHSKGLLIATLIWEGGESVEQLTVRDGIVTEESIEL